jgi:hypothetical protein
MQPRSIERKEDAVGRAAKAGKDVGVAIDQSDLVLDRQGLGISDCESTLTQEVFQLGFTDDLPLTAGQSAATDQRSAATEVQRLFRWAHIGGNARRHFPERAHHVHVRRIELLEQRLRNDGASQSRRFIERQDPLRWDAK